MARVEVEQRGEVDVGHAVRVGGAEAAALEPVAHARDAAARGRLLAGVDALDGEARPGSPFVATNSSISSPLWPRQSTKRRKPCSA